ncbi:MAG: hypothetical protein EA401_13510 [Planctomycetota bacterium]|nr:MAG: hypothetical protein EA401_13510 [Planctomycetota bacterium]
MSHGIRPALIIAGAIVIIALLGEALLSGPRRAAASEHYHQSLRLFSLELANQGRRQQLYHSLYQRPSHFPEHWNAEEFPVMVTIWQQISRDFSPSPGNQTILIRGPEDSASFPMPRNMAQQSDYAQVSSQAFTPQNAIIILAAVMNDPIGRSRPTGPE